MAVVPIKNGPDLFVLGPLGEEFFGLGRKAFVAQIKALLLLVQTPPVLLQLDPRGISPAQTGNRLDHLEHVFDVRRVDRLHDPGTGQRGARLGEVAAPDFAHFPGVLGQLLEFFDPVALTPPVDVAAATPLAQVLRLDRLSRPVPFEHRPNRFLGVEPLQDLRTAPAVVEAAIDLGADGQRQAGDLTLARHVGFIGCVR